MVVGSKPTSGGVGGRLAVGSGDVGGCVRGVYGLLVGAGAGGGGGGGLSVEKKSSGPGGGGLRGTSSLECSSGGGTSA